MPKLTIDDKEIEVENGKTVMQACEKAGIEIPHFCYHKRLEIAGNCRMCLVEMERSPKLVASCAMPASDGMVIRTDTEKVKKSREGVMEFLLINHPLDCPICDQGGECDLQDQAFKYGSGKKRYTENKRSVTDKNLGPLVKTHMTRCIHCTRCIRFSTDVAGVPEMGAVGRGEDMEIVSYLEKTLTSELSGNVIDLCPVGALTSKPYAFNARSWELDKTVSVDVMDAVGSRIRVDSRGQEVMRILPAENDDVNEEWISDKARFSYDGLKSQRLDDCYVRSSGKLKKSTWQKALMQCASKIKSFESKEIATIAGTTCSVEAMFLLKRLFTQLGSKFIDANQFGYNIDASSRSNYLFNTEIKNIEKADLCLLVGANPKQMAPVLNARIGKMVRSGKMQVLRIGEQTQQDYNITELGSNPQVLNEILAGSHECSDIIKNAKNVMIVAGDSVMLRDDNNAIINNLYKIVNKYQLDTEDWNSFNILHNHASAVGAIDIGFWGDKKHSSKEIIKRTKSGKIKLLYLMSADDVDLSSISDDCFVIYQGHHGDSSAARADVILPEAAYTEQDGIFVNLEGRVQYAKPAIDPLGAAKKSIDVVLELAKELDISLGVQLREGALQETRALLVSEHKLFANDKHITKTQRSLENIDPQEISEEPLKQVEVEYYATDQISRASVTMARCIAARNEQKGRQEGIEKQKKGGAAA